MVYVFTSSRYKFSRNDVAEYCQSLLNAHGVGDRLVNVVFVGKRKMKAIASEYKKEPVALPVLSFSYHDANADKGDQPLLGEIYLCYPQVVLLAAERNKAVDATMRAMIEHGLENILQ